MSVGSLDPAAMVQRWLEYATKNLRIEQLLIQLGLDPDNVTYEVVFNRLLDVALANITFANMFALVGAIFLIATFVVHTIVPLRVLNIVSSVFFLMAAALAGSVPQFFLYLLALPINFVRLFQIRNLVKKARSSARGDLSLDWIKPFMTPRTYQKGDVLFRKGDAATEMFLTVAGRFLVTEIGIEIPAGRILGELGLLSPKNHRTQSVECIENGEVLTIDYEKLREIYVQNPEFGYYFLRLTSDRLLQNHARLEGLVEEAKAALAAATTATGADSKQNAGFAAGVSPAEIRAARRRAQALALVERYANYSAASGFIPVPIANMATITAVQVRMVRALSELYGVPFDGNRAYSVVIGLLGGVMPTRLATAATSTIVYFVPGFNLFGLAVSSVTASAYARRIGRMLIDHFEREEAIERERQALKRARSWRHIWATRLATSDLASRWPVLELGIRRGWLRRQAD